MDDLISRKALLKELRRELRECCRDGEEFGGESILLAEGIESAIDAVKYTKTVDAVEVVRCKDCKNYNVFRLECHNGHMNGCIGIDGFCSYGERKEKGDGRT